MIAKRLASAKIVFGLKGELAGATDELGARSQIAELGAQFHAHPPDRRNERYSDIGAGIAVLHLRVDNLAEPELILGLSPDAWRSTLTRLTSSCCSQLQPSGRPSICSFCSASRRCCRRSAGTS